MRPTALLDAGLGRHGQNRRRPSSGDFPDLLRPSQRPRGRVFRIKTESVERQHPEPRTSHNISNVELLSQNDRKIELRFNWQTLSYRYKIIDTYFGVFFYTLELR